MRFFGHFFWRFSMTSTVFSLLSAIVLSACGPSPLLNHVDASDKNPEAIEPAGNPGQCTLAFPKQKLCGNIFWTAQPKVGKASAFRLQFHSMDTRKAQEPAGELQVELWMPSMGHGSSPVTIQHTADSVGSYEITNAYFIMGGDWEVRVRLVNESVTEQATVAVEL